MTNITIRLVYFELLLLLFHNKILILVLFNFCLNSSKIRTTRSGLVDRTKMSGSVMRISEDEEDEEDEEDIAGLLARHRSDVIH